MKEPASAASASFQEALAGLRADEVHCDAMHLEGHAGAERDEAIGMVLEGLVAHEEVDALRRPGEAVRAHSEAPDHDVAHAGALQRLRRHLSAAEQAVVPWRLCSRNPGRYFISNAATVARSRTNNRPPASVGTVHAVFVRTLASPCTVIPVGVSVASARRPSSSSTIALPSA